ncbi:MAG: ribosomal-protein-alanine N-acetyltransferase [Parvicellaceae bacterium]|jgi:ribosomal-protein-alanine N-acetyltransferase
MKDTKHEESQLKEEQLTYKLLNDISGKDSSINRGDVTLFLTTHLGQYGDSLADIDSAIDYVFEGTGGFILLQYFNGTLSGAVVVNETGMKGYIPENILVYLAINSKYRRKGLGKSILLRTIMACKGDIALHVTSDNPASLLYKKVGFTNPYLEMRLKR